LSVPAACTIVAKPLLAHARAIAASFARRHPDIPFYVGLTDRADGCFDPAAEPFTVADADALGLPAAMRFRYEQQELSYAATPSLLRHVLDRGHDRVLFFKQESLVTGDHAPVLERLDRAAIVLAPHLLEPLADSRRELAVLLAGTYNLGFLGLADGPPARAFLDWWGERLATLCRHDVARGLHFEQRWMDFVPGMFDGVDVMREPGAVVGHWSLPERRVALDGECVTVDGTPCRLVRFSGYDLDEPDWATRYDRRLRTGDLGDAGLLFARFRAAVLAAGHEEARGWPYAFACFDDGTPIPRAARELHAALGERGSAFGDPFAPAGPFRRFLAEPDDELPQLTRLWAHVVRARPDVRRAYASDDGLDVDALGGWARTTGRAEHALPEDFPLLAGA
jgi:hypothetical protein